MSFLLGYDYELVDGGGRQPKDLPVQDGNDIHQVDFFGLIILMVLRYGKSHPVENPVYIEQFYEGLCT